MNAYKKYVAGTLIAVFVAIAGAQDTTPPATPPASPPADPPARAPADPPASQPRGDDDVFIPTEEVEAAEELAFPVDI